MITFDMVFIAFVILCFVFLGVGILMGYNLGKEHEKEAKR